MLGPEEAATRAATWLTTRIPARLRRLEARLGLPAGSLADPARVLDHDAGPVGLEDWPSVYVLPQRTTAIQLIDVRDDGGEAYRVTYTIRVLAWVRADDYDTTDTLRMRYALAIREALLERKQLATSVDADGEFAVDPSSIREDYGPVVVDEAKRTIAGVLLDLNVTLTEVAEGPDPYGTADTFDVTVHPALT